MSDYPTFETERLVLKPRTLEHAQASFRYFNNWNVIKNLNDSIPWPYPETGGEEHYLNNVLPNIQAGKCLLWTIFERINLDVPIGSVEYRLEMHPQGDRGFWLGEPFWGKGYMTEAIECLNDYIFFEVGVPKLKLSNHKMNIGSRRVKEKTGAKFIETKKEQWRDKEIEMEYWELTSKDWKQYRAQ